VSEQRDAIARELAAAGIASAVYYPIPLHEQEVFRSDYPGLSLPVTESVAQRCLSLPIFPEMSDDEISQVVQAIRLVAG
jgi:UDP-N-acetyl-3-dehydro-alpha-D-glucosamine 3-aminotranferase